MRLCADCKTPLSDPGSRRCRGCYRGDATTPLRVARARLGLSLAVISVRSEVPYATVKYVASGRPASRRVALALERVTGVDAGVLMKGARFR